jgi:ATP-binding cassette subfamily C protein CydCD
VLGPAHFVRDRTGDVMLSLVEGVQQLEVYFGQYCRSSSCPRSRRVLIFAFVAFLDLPVALVCPVTALAALLAPGSGTLGQPGQPRAQPAYGAFGAEFLDACRGWPR